MALTKRVVEGLKPTKEDYVAWDNEVSGFGISVRPTGRKSYIVVYRAGLGETPQFASLPSARPKR